MSITSENVINIINHINLQELDNISLVSHRKIFSNLKNPSPTTIFLLYIMEQPWKDFLSVPFLRLDAALLDFPFLAPLTISLADTSR